MYIRVAVYPAAKHEEVKVLGRERYEIKVKESAERNQANRRVKELLAEKYGIPDNLVRLVSGHQNSRKIFAVPD